MNKLLSILVVLLIAVLIVFPMVIKSDSVVNLAVNVLMYIALAASWNILGGFGGQTNLGHAAFFGAGSLVTRLLWLSGWNIFPSLFAGALAPVVLALLVGIPAFRLKGVYFAIGTLALSQILYITIGNTFSTISSLPPQDLAVYSLTPRYYLLLGIALLTVGVSYVLIHSKQGLGIMAVREEEDAAESLGVSSLKYKVMALAISAFFGGLAGGGFAFYQIGYYPQLTFGPEWTFNSMMMAYIGGVGTIAGPILGAVFYVVLRELLALNLAEFHVIAFGILFILVVLFLPRGFMGIWEKLKQRLEHRPERKPALFVAKSVR